MASSPMKHQTSRWKKKKKLTTKQKGALPVFPSMDSTVAVDNDVDFFEKSSPLIHRSPVPPAHLPLVLRPRWPPPGNKTLNFASTIIHSIFPTLHSLLPSCQRHAFPPLPSLSSTRRRRLTGTLFGPRKGRVSFAVQDEPSSEPGLLLELAFPTCHLIQEMASGTVRILLECEKVQNSNGGGGNKKLQQQLGVSLWEEPVWTMYCNGRRSGYAVSRPWGEPDRHVFSTVRAVSAGAGVLPPSSPTPINTPTATPKKVDGGYGYTDMGYGSGDCSSEMMFMRSKFERVVGSKDSEAFYMLSPDGGGGGPELSIFLLRL